MKPEIKTSSADILTLVSKEKFRRRLLISTRIIAVLLIFVLIWIGYIQINYAQQVRTITTTYGSLGYCYMCGLETFRTCSCQYLPDLIQKGNVVNKTEIALLTAKNNVKDCVIREDPTLSSKLNFSGINFNSTQ